MHRLQSKILHLVGAVQLQMAVDTACLQCQLHKIEQGNAPLILTKGLCIEQVLLPTVVVPFLSLIETACFCVIQPLIVEVLGQGIFASTLHLLLFEIIRCSTGTAHQPPADLQ